MYLFLYVSLLLTLLSSWSQSSSMESKSRDCDGCFCTAWRYVLAHYLAVGWLWPARRIPEGIACCCKMLWLCFCSGCHSLIHWLWIQQESPWPSHFHLHVWLSPPPSFHLLKTLHDKHKISHFDSSVETFYLQQSTDITQVSIFSHELLFSLQSTYTLRKNGTIAVPGAVPFYPKGIWTYRYFKGTY